MTTGDVRYHGIDAHKEHGIFLKKLYGLVKNQLTWVSHHII